MAIVCNCVLPSMGRLCPACELQAQRAAAQANFCYPAGFWVQKPENLRGKAAEWYRSVSRKDAPHDDEPRC